MKVIIKENYDEMGKEAARIFAAAIRKNPKIVLGLATGSTPISCYRELVRLHKEEGLDFSKVITFNLDEYLGISPEHDQSYRYFMNDNLFNHININKKNTHVLDGQTKNPEKTCKEYEAAIKAAGGIEIQLLGIGGNGHIAFNEPGSPAKSRTRVVDLTPETIQDNARFFASAAEVPKQALSMGNGSILEAKKIILLANKGNKADAVQKSVEGPVTEKVPASLLQNHKDVVFIVEKEAASKLKQAGRSASKGKVSTSTSARA
jgi:glucosamine-6-phosphate deaminase